MTFTEMHVKWSVTLVDRLGPERHRFCIVCVYGFLVTWLSDLNALLTKKLPKFLSRLNEMSGGRENMCLVSGSLRRIV